MGRLPDQGLNPGINLPSSPIQVVYRSDGSGTSYIFTNYLSVVSPTWSSGPGTGKSVSWPVGVGQKGNEGVAGFIKSTPYTIGYVELAYALQNNFTFAKILNSAGNYVAPSLTSVAADAAQKPNITSVDFCDRQPGGCRELPDLRVQLGARLPAAEERFGGYHLGQGPGLANPRWSESGGVAQVRAAPSQHPAARPDDAAPGDWT